MPKAEELLQVGEIDNAIMRNRRCRDFSAVIRLVSKYRPNWLLTMHLTLGQQLESEGGVVGRATHAC